MSTLRHLEPFGVVPEGGSLRELEHAALRSARFSKYDEAEVRRFYDKTGVADAHNPHPIAP